MTRRRANRRQRSSRQAVPLVRTIVGQRLRALRQGRSLSQEHLAARSRLSGKFLGEVERGEKSISVDSLYRIAVALSVSLGYLTDVQGPTSREAETVLAMLVTLPGSELRRAGAVLRAMLHGPSV
jgi:XRE family transcriptional regulator, regulator of sulfur utilization